MEATENGELVRAQEVADLDLVVRRERGKGKVQVCEFGEIKLPSVLEEARPVKSKAFEVANTSKDGGRCATDNGGTAVGDTTAGARRGCAWCASSRVGTELDRGAALIDRGKGISQGSVSIHDQAKRERSTTHLTPHVAASVQRAGVKG